MIDEALELVKIAFAGKTDKGGKPYIGHLLRVQKTVAENGGDEQQQTIALLHDIIEDTDYTKDDLLKIFPSEIVIAVEILTKKKGQDYSDYLCEIMTNEDAVFVKLADLKDNMDLTRLSVLIEKDIERVKKYHSAFLLLSSIRTPTF